MANKACYHHNKLKAGTALSKMFKHNFRIDYCENIDTSRSHMNEVLIDLGTNQTYETRVNEMIRKSSYYENRSVRKDAVLGLDVQLSFGPMETVGPAFDLDLWKQQSVQWLQDKFGKENVISAVLHMDESHPHIHAFVVPMIDGRLSCKTFCGGKGKMHELQSGYADAVANLGLIRGVQYSVAKHEDIQAFYGAVKQRQQEKLPDVRDYESAEEYALRAQEAFTIARLQDLHDVNSLQHENSSLKGYMIQAKKANDDIERLKKELEKAQAELSKRQEEIGVYEKKLQRWNELLYGIQHNLPDGPTAKQTLENLKAITAAARDAMESEYRATEDSNSSYGDTL